MKTRNRNYDPQLPCAAELIRKSAAEVPIPRMSATSLEGLAAVQSLSQAVEHARLRKGWVSALAGQGPGFDATNAGNAREVAPAYDGRTEIPTGPQIREELSGRFTCQACRQSFNSLPDAANHLQLGNCRATQLPQGDSTAWPARAATDERNPAPPSLAPVTPNSQIPAGESRPWPTLLKRGRVEPEDVAETCQDFVEIFGRPTARMNKGERFAEAQRIQSLLQRMYGAMPSDRFAMLKRLVSGTLDLDLAA
ncbi:MAG TPA: hypothetical protein VLV89_10345 [Candidatus Acidoferrum sp.]|nr:hypothetical protein [Candidatus Acidoferrum sp.]